MTDVKTVFTPTERKKADVSQIWKKKLQKTHELKSAFLSIIDRLSFFTFKILCLELLMYFPKAYKNINFHTQEYQYRIDLYLSWVNIEKS